MCSVPYRALLADRDAVQAKWSFPLPRRAVSRARGSVSVSLQAESGLPVLRSAQAGVARGLRLAVMVGGDGRAVRRGEYDDRGAWIFFDRFDLRGACIRVPCTTLWLCHAMLCYAMLCCAVLFSTKQDPTDPNVSTALS